PACTLRLSLEGGKSLARVRTSGDARHLGEQPKNCLRSVAVNVRKVRRGMSTGRRVESLRGGSNTGPDGDRVAVPGGERGHLPGRGGHRASGGGVCGPTHPRSRSPDRAVAGGTSG